MGWCTAVEGILVDGKAAEGTDFEKTPHECAVVAGSPAEDMAVAGTLVGDTVAECTAAEEALARRFFAEDLPFPPLVLQNPF